MSKSFWSYYRLEVLISLVGIMVVCGMFYGLYSWQKRDEAEQARTVVIGGKDYHLDYGLEDVEEIQKGVIVEANGHSGVIESITIRK